MSDKPSENIMDLNKPGVVVEVSKEEAADLGAFEEDAMSEEDALQATEEQED
uniref:conjugal transfer protein TraD n=1 Tax=Marinobacterium profundum TaxID=1714300 RepID=UPI000B2DB9B2|nr:conjugal transfer protein TraD [Marinobacterium profundum]